jgi:hypothetical protein
MIASRVKSSLIVVFEWFPWSIRIPLSQFVTSFWSGFRES